ncbi:MAG: AbrB/MazE/SpoVT family DNA-binding domain-containing protein [Burkholderiales bacterium]
MTVAVVTSKGRITIPKSVRERLKVDAGDRVEFVESAQGVFTLVAATRDVQALKGLIPKLGKSVSIDDMNRAIARAGSKR